LKREVRETSKTRRRQEISKLASPVDVAIDERDEQPDAGLARDVEPRLTRGGGTEAQNGHDLLAGSSAYSSNCHPNFIIPTSHNP
jgi:hypothetical protein